MEFLSDPDSLIHQIARFWPEHALLQGLLIVSLSLFIEDATTLFVATLISLDRMSFAEGMLWLSLGINPFAMFTCLLSPGGQTSQ